MRNSDEKNYSTIFFPIVVVCLELDFDENTLNIKKSDENKHKKKLLSCMFKRKSLPQSIFRFMINWFVHQR